MSTEQEDLLSTLLNEVRALKESNERVAKRVEEQQQTIDRLTSDNRRLAEAWKGHEEFLNKRRDDYAGFRQQLPFSIDLSTVREDYRTAAAELEKEAKNRHHGTSHRLFDHPQLVHVLLEFLPSQITTTTLAEVSGSCAAIVDDYLEDETLERMWRWYAQGGDAELEQETRDIANLEIPQQPLSAYPPAVTPYPYSPYPGGPDGGEEVTMTAQARWRKKYSAGEQFRLMVERIRQHWSVARQQQYARRLVLGFLKIAPLLPQLPVIAAAARMPNYHGAGFNICVILPMMIKVDLPGIKLIGALERPHMPGNYYSMGIPFEEAATYSMVNVVFLSAKTFLHDDHAQTPVAMYSHLASTGPNSSMVRVKMLSGQHVIFIGKPFSGAIQLGPSSSQSMMVPAGPLALEALDLRHLRGVTQLADSLLFSSPVKRIALFSFKNVSVIETGFLCNCRQLMEITIHPDDVGTKSDEGWADAAIKVTNSRPAVAPPSYAPHPHPSMLPGYHQPSTLGLLSGLKKLKSIQLDFLRNLTHLESKFLSGAESLTTVDLSPLRKITSVGTDVLSKTGITHLDLTPLHNVSLIGDDFLRGSLALRELNLGPKLLWKTVGDGFLRGSNVSQVIIDGLTQLHTIGSNFLAESTVERFTLRRSSIVRIGDRFLSGCEQLSYLEVSELSSLHEIGSEFVADCTSLRIFNRGGPGCGTGLGRVKRMGHERLRGDLERGAQRLADAAPALLGAPVDDEVAADDRQAVVGPVEPDVGAAVGVDDRVDDPVGLPVGRASGRGVLLEGRDRGRRRISGRRGGGRG